jgi:REP element-mobilizing transposase RayT
MNAMAEPIYTRDNCRNPAYQLNWSYSVFWRAEPRDFSWLEELKQLNEPDHIRILQHQFKPPRRSQFLISTRPNVAPLMIAQRVKGRLQHLVAGGRQRPFRRNYSIRSVGSSKRSVIEYYLARQLQHHQTMDTALEKRLAPFQIYLPQVDLSQPSRTSHAIYWYNLHLVLASAAQRLELRDESLLTAVRDMILRIRKARKHRLSRASPLPNHLHLSFGAPLEQSPEEIALAYMNNLAYACGMKKIFAYSYFVGTFGEYDLNLIARQTAAARL